MTVNMRDAVQRAAISTHPNQMQAIQCLDSSVTCFERGDVIASRLLIWVSGALLSPELCHSTWTAIARAAERPYMPSSD